MLTHQNLDSIDSYERACASLALNPQNQAAKYQAVFALARMGSTQLARSEYERYGLSNVQGHEDIMALGARIAKDLYLASDSSAAQEYAREAAQKYEAAYQDTRGYYSGVNAATMHLLAGTDPSETHARANQILSVLPATENLTPTDYYFIEATRSECFLLLGQSEKAHKSLSKAIKFDPLNYPAHASTLKQFRLITAHQSTASDWLNEFSPPRSAHFAGHIWHDDSHPLQTSDTLLEEIQTHDIGYGYGALAAGADIEIAEELLAAGAEIHIVLPCPIADFIQFSIRPYGPTWLKRFETCMAAAQSVTFLNNVREKDADQSRRLASRIAMGKSILKARQFQVRPCQLLVQKNNDEMSLTNELAQMWAMTQYDQIIVPLSETYLPHRIKSGANTDPVLEPHINLVQSNQQKNARRSNLDAVMQTATDGQGTDESIFMFYDLEFLAEQPLDLSELPRGVFISEAIAATLALTQDNPDTLTFGGIINLSENLAVRVYTIQ